MPDTRCEACGIMYSPPRAGCQVCYKCQPVVDETGTQLVFELVSLTCPHCDCNVFRVGLALETGDVIVLCQKCRLPNRTGAKLSPEKHREALDRRAAQMNSRGFGAN
jgi:hypothetical protein